MEPSERITRSRARASGINVSANVAAAAASTSARPAQPASAPRTPAPKKLTATERNVVALRDILANPNVTVAELKAFMNDRPAYMFAYAKWQASLYSWIKSKRWSLFYCYLNLCKEKIGFESMIWMKDVLETLQEYQPDEMFGKNPFWQELKGSLDDNTIWYKNYVVASLTNEARINRLISKGWFWHFDLLWMNAKDLAPSTLAEVLAFIIKAPEFRKPFNEFVHFDVLLEQIVKCEPSTSLPSSHADLNAQREVKQKLLTFYTSYFNALPKDTLIIIEVVDNSYSRHVFIDTCLEKGYNDLLLAFYSKFDIHRTENKAWMNKCFRSLIYATLPINKSAYNRLKIRLESIIRHYKLNVNNIYMDLSDIMRKEFPTRDPLRNPDMWAGQNLPLVALAVMTNRTDIVQWLLTLGAKLNRCAISMQDLTTNPKMLALFRADTTASKIQKAYLQHTYSPNHAKQATRQAAWDALAHAKKSNDARV